MTKSLPIIAPDVPTLDNSALDAFNRCQRLYQLSVVHAKTGKRTAALDFGSLFHLGLDVWYKTRDPLRALQTVQEAEYEDRPDDFRTKARCILMLSEYFEYYGVDDHWKILSTETPFDIMGEVDRRILPYGGRIDLVVEWHDKYWIVDHKTTSRFGSTFYEGFVPDTQMVGYAWAASQLVGVPIHGVIINTIIVHKVKKSADQQFNRRPLQIHDWMTEEWLEQTIDTRLQIEKAHASGRFLPRWRSCVGKYGRCGFYDLCRTRPENRERVLATEYEDSTWDWRGED